MKKNSLPSYNLPARWSPFRPWDYLDGVKILLLIAAFPALLVLAWYKEFKHKFGGHKYEPTILRDGSGKTWIYGKNAECGRFAFLCSCGSYIEEFIL